MHIVGTGRYVLRLLTGSDAQRGSSLVPGIACVLIEPWRMCVRFLLPLFGVELMQLIREKKVLLWLKDKFTIYLGFAACQRFTFTCIYVQLFWPWLLPTYMFSYFGHDFYIRACSVILAMKLTSPLVQTHFLTAGFSFRFSSSTVTRMQVLTAANCWSCDALGHMLEIHRGKG